MSNDLQLQPARLSKLAITAAVLAFLLAASGLLGSLRQPFLAPFALVPLAAGIGILLRRVWSAYGFALVQLAGLAAILLLSVRAGTVPKSQLWFTAAMNAVLCVLFFVAGRLLARSGGKRGLAWPWITIAILETVPLIFLQAFVIPAGSMEDTLLIGDHVLVRVFPKVRPNDGDIVVFHYPMDRSQTSIKRVIGSPGDHIRIEFRMVYRNGSKLMEAYAVHKMPTGDNYRDNFPSNIAPSYLSGTQAVEEMLKHHMLNGELIVPPGKYFVLGDNRDNSLDSRYWGLLDASDIIGKPIVIYASEVPPAEDLSGKKILSKPQIRWNRLFKPL